jgi:hypothetical protein
MMGQRDIGRWMAGSRFCNAVNARSISSSFASAMPLVRADIRAANARCKRPGLLDGQAVEASAQTDALRSDRPSFGVTVSIPIVYGAATCLEAPSMSGGLACL